MRTLFITQPGDGHLNPLVPLARALHSAGHPILFAVAHSYLDDVSRLGLPSVAAGPDYRWDAALQRWPECVNHMGADSPAFWVETVNRDITVPLVHDLRRIVAEFRPNLLVAEAASFAAASILREVESLPLVLTAWGTEPGVQSSLDLFGIGQNACRSAFGLAPWDGKAIPTDLWISFTPPRWGKLDREPLPETWRAHLPLDARSEPVVRSIDRPLVYATLGSIYGTAHKLMRSFIQAIELGGWQGVVTVGRNNDAAKFQHPPTIDVVQYVPQADVLPRASVVLCHGGFGTVMGSIDAGVPMVIVPLGADQLQNAERAQRVGIATVVEPARASPQVLRDAIAEAMTSDSYCSAVRALRAEAMAMPTMANAVNRLVEMAKT
jgi:UDP:flavonoid glycosyltransferase YjiC (YdhE family)